MRIFTEIERATYWNEYMFFSVNGGDINRRNKIYGIQVAKLNHKGLYSYYGEVANSKGYYGPNVDKNLRLLYWYVGEFRINNPLKQNLFYSSGHWSLRIPLEVTFI